MDISISDLLDGLQEVELDIQPKVSVPGNRIEELTMKKIHKHEKPGKRGLFFVTKVLVAAIIIATLAIPVMAAGGFTFKDWLTGPEREEIPETVPKEIQLDLAVGSESSSLVAYHYHLSIYDAEATATGLTYLCEEYCTDIPIGTLTTTDGYWLEKWDGSQFLPLDGNYAGTTQIPVENDTAYRWEINWEDVYGTLDTGAYHLGKIYTHTTPDGETSDFVVYVYFRIFTKEMGPYVTQVQDAMEELRNRHSLHLLEIQYDTHNEEYDYHATEIWKDGDNYLSEQRYCKEDGTILKRRGYMLRDGVGYLLDWSGDSVTSEVCFWEKADFIIPRNFTLWEAFLQLSDAYVGQLYIGENTLYFYGYHDFINDAAMSQQRREELDRTYPLWNHDYSELAYRFDETGRLAAVTQTYMRSLDPDAADPRVTHTLEVYDTDSQEIAQIIEMQDVSRPSIFSWEADRTGHYTKLAQFEGFVNTDPASAISTPSEAIERARSEAIAQENPKYRDGYNYNMTNVWFDPDAGIWKVRFYHSQDPYFQTIVWMDEQGITQMKSLSSHEEFD